MKNSDNIGLRFLEEVAKGSVANAKEMLRKGVDPNLVDKWGCSPVLIALKKKNRSMLALLTQANADLRSVTSDNLYPMAVASIMGDVQCLSILSSYCADFEAPLESEPSALEYALDSGKIKAANYLIDHGADINVRGSCGQLLISRMMSSKNKEAVDILIRKGVDLNDPSIDREKLRGILRYKKSTRREIEYFLFEKKNSKELIELLESGNFNSAFEIVSNKKISFEKRGKHGIGMISLAAKSQDFSIGESTSVAQQPSIKELLMEKMIEKGFDAADIDSQYGRNALHELIEAGDEKTAVYLTSRGLFSSILNRSDKNLCRPVHLAVQKDMKKLVLALSQKGADINPVNRKGLTPLHICATHVNSMMAEILLSKGANINLKTRDGRNLNDLLDCSRKNFELFDSLIRARSHIDAAMNIFNQKIYSQFPIKRPIR